eukprot:gene14998-16700_t
MKELLVKEVLELYQNELSQNGKPQNIEEFTVLAAIIAKIDPVDSGKVGTDNGSDSIFKVVSLATGTKCVGEELIDKQGHIIHDSHAEVIARRGFLRYLLELLLLLETTPSLENELLCPLMRKNPESLKEGYKIKHNWLFYLYISDSPCGDACIYPSISGEMCFTGAKLAAMIEDRSCPHYDSASSKALGSIEISQKDNGLIVEKDQQLVGPARTKSSRSDTQHPTNSMSCSDKICRWLHLGLQGKVLYNLVGKVELSGIIVGRDPSAATEAQLQALQRALRGRCETDSSEAKESIDMLIVDEEGLQFSSSKGNVKHRLTNTATEESTTSTTANIEVTYEDTVNGIGNKRTADSNELSSKKKKIKKLQPVPCGTSINWISSPPTSTNTNNTAHRPPPLVDLLLGYFNEIKHNIKVTKSGSQEVTIAHTGLPHGTTQKARNGKGSVEGQSSDRPRGPKKLSISRLSPYALQWLCQLSYDQDKESRETKPVIEYKEWKNSLLTHPEYEENAVKFFKTPIFSAWKRKQQTLDTLITEERLALSKEQQ